MKLSDDLLPIHDLAVELGNEAVRIDRPAAPGRLQRGSPKHPAAPFMEGPEVMSEAGGPAMSPFLAAQGDSPFDPAPMLILADYLEENGDEAGPAALRGLVSAGIASVHQVAISGGIQLRSDSSRQRGNGRLDAAGAGVGDEFGRSAVSELGNGSGKGDDFGFGAGTGYGLPEQPSGRPSDGGGRGDATSEPAYFPGGIARIDGSGSGGSDDFGGRWR